MSKKLLVVIAAVVVLVWVFWPDNPSGEVWTNNKLSASYPKGVIDETSS